MDGAAVGVVLFAFSFVGAALLLAIVVTGFGVFEELRNGVASILGRLLLMLPWAFLGLLMLATGLALIASLVSLVYHAVTTVV